MYTLHQSKQHWRNNPLYHYCKNTEPNRPSCPNLRVPQLPHKIGESSKCPNRHVLCIYRPAHSQPFLFPSAQCRHPHPPFSCRPVGYCLVTRVWMYVTGSHFGWFRSCFCRREACCPEAKLNYSAFFGTAEPLTYLLTSVAAWNCLAPFLMPSQT